MDGRKILVVGDNHSLLDAVRYNLLQEGYTVQTATDGLQALDAMRNQRPELIILDLMLPRLSGLEVCRLLREETSIPILMLTACGDEEDWGVVPGRGAVEYMTRPICMPEMVARVHAMLQRSEAGEQASRPENAILKMSNLVIDLARRSATVNGGLLELTPKGFDLLAFLARNPGLVFSRAQLLEKVWGYDFAGDTRTVDVHIRWLRARIEEDPRKPKRLLTVRGVGYKLEG